MCFNGLFEKIGYRKEWLFAISNSYIVCLFLIYSTFMPKIIARFLPPLVENFSVLVPSQGVVNSIVYNDDIEGMLIVKVVEVPLKPASDIIEYDTVLSSSPSL